MKLKHVNCLKGFLPSKIIFTIFVILYVSGFIFAYFKPFLARSFFNGGFFLGYMDVKFIFPHTVAFNYIFNQFVLFLGGVSAHLFLNNLGVSLACVFTGIPIVSVIFLKLFTSMGAVNYLLMVKVGIIKAFLILGGSFHLYFEFLAAMLSVDAFLKFYRSFFHFLMQRNFKEFKEDILTDFLPLILRIIILLAIAAILDVFWSTWWVYILTQHYVPWINFYMGFYSCKII
ncbi:hypothetical protein [Methanobacterium aggregans]|uniref:hypothetical protein n=1 Tax=Methanobacterium aggregans TaxID=1615586 RepID=UPI00321176EB